MRILLGSFGQELRPFSCGAGLNVVSRETEQSAAVRWDYRREEDRSLSL